MNILVLYESQFGNTQRLAEVIGKELEARGPVQVTNFAHYEPPVPADVNLLVLGAPTQAHGMTPAMKAFIERLEPKVAGLPVAIFDTRVKGPMLLWGSAGRAMVPTLTRNGFKLIDEPESFTVSFGKPPELASGEEGRARAWAEAIADRVSSPVATGA